ncbi:helix-turn-helix domain-containing protein [Nocardia sp. SYP-A9097]|uniref:helix-turn-helix domain-containing protein n=1 Tax=Nocardia sp. SYP-A9097 TaxID=2663237 RepID=UPI00129AE8F8|nr:helix-turn-helix domain-containing protein [Nocardia sp. SYP-A9097]MRH86169.1 helix-turn-helix domain-containing protein [Nocardia sp. SYP-A9097]
MSGNPFGAYIRLQRKAAGLTREQLADRINLSVSLIEKIELGTRTTTLPTLKTLFDGLNVPPLHRRYILNLSLPGGLGHNSDAVPEPTLADLADLASLPHPAGFFLVPTFTMVAVNDAYRTAFPGIVNGTNLIEWLLLNPCARDTVLDWHREAHRLVHGLRVLTPDPATNPHITEIINRCQAIPEWDHLWNTDLPAPALFRDHITIRDPSNHQVRHLNARLYSPEFPDRPWWLHRLIPIQDGVTET